jgi:hypothetical protein
MDPGSLLLRLAPLLSDADKHLAEIEALFEQYHGTAEVQVARVWVETALSPMIARGLRSRDARDRSRVLDLATRFYSAARLAQTLRRLVRDPNTVVRWLARQRVYRARFRDVALRDARFQEPPRRLGSPWLYTLGGANASGWSAGLYKQARRTRRYDLTPRLEPRYRTSARAPDAERSALPGARTTEALAALLGVSEHDIRRFTRPGAAPGSAYVEFDVPKARGGTRRLAAPRAALKRVQRRILDHILAGLPVHDACHAYVPGRSLVTNTAPHVGAAVIVKTDLRDFFPSIHYRRVFGLFQYYGYDVPASALLAKLTTYMPRTEDGQVCRPGVLPQGAPTSPAIANLVCRGLDARLTGLARRCGGRYTRYADDLTFSFPAEPGQGIGRLFWWIDQICAQEGFAERADKRRVLRPSQRQLVTGVVVNAGQTVPRAARRRFRALLHHVRTHGRDEQGRSARELRLYLFGYAAYVRMVQPEAGARLLAEVRALFGRTDDSDGGGGEAGQADDSAL